jgi:methyltransferase family protein
VKRPPLLRRALVAGVRAFNRNPWTSERLELFPRDPRALYAEDGLWTYRGHDFTNDDRFRTAYQRAVTAAGFDYEIRWRVHTALWAASTAATIDGSFVECGTGRGFVASAICQYLAWNDRPFYLYDTFEPTRLDATGARTDDVHPCYATSADKVRENFAQWPGTRLVVGKLPDTLVDSPERVAFLHMDLNHAPVEQACVRHFWRRMVPGAVLLYDDYGYEGLEGIRRAADEVGRELGFEILACPTGQGIAVKPGANGSAMDSAERPSAA